MPDSEAAPFEDAFLASWADGQLGKTTTRLVLVLHVEMDDEWGSGGVQRAAQIDALIRQFGGETDAGRGADLRGIWGRERLLADDADRVMMAAAAVRKTAGLDGDVRCLVDAASIETAKTATGAEAVVVRPPPRAAFDMAGSSPHVTLVSATFKTVAGLTDGLMPVSFPGSATRQVAEAYFALRERTAGCSARDQMQSCACHARLISQLDALGDLKPVIVAAAVAGESFAPAMLARMIEIEADRLDGALMAACRAGVLVSHERRDGAPRYRFQNADLRMAAYHTVTAGDRMRLHQKAAKALSDTELKQQRRPVVTRLRAGELDERHQIGPSPAAAIARHHQRADNSFQSMRWLSKAAWQSIAAGKVAEAIQQLQAALEQDGPDRGRTALKRALLQLLGVQLAVTRGNGSEAVFDAYQRSIEMAHRAAPPAMTAATANTPKAAKLHLNWGHEFRSLWLAQSCHLVKGEVRAALTIGNLLIRQMRLQGEQSELALGQRILVHRMQALSLLLSGDLAEARNHYDIVLDQYVYERHAILRFGYGSDQAALAHAHRAWLYTIAGESDAAARATQAAMQHCERLHHAHTSAHVMSVLSLAAFSGGAHGEAVLAAREARAVASENGFAYWTAWADVMLAACDARRAGRNGCAALEAAMAAYRATGALQLCPIIHAQLGAAALRDGDAQTAERWAETGLDMISWNGCVLYRPELMRVKALAQHAMADQAASAETLEIGFECAWDSGALLFARQIAREGLRLTGGQAQIVWQARHNQLSVSAPERLGGRGSSGDGRVETRRPTPMPGQVA